MPVDPPLKDALEALREQLSAHPDPRAKSVAGATEQYLGRDVPDVQSHRSLRSEFQAAASYFRASHPNLAGMLDRAVVQLAEMGI